MKLFSMTALTMTLFGVMTAQEGQVLARINIQKGALNDTGPAWEYGSDGAPTTVLLDLFAISDPTRLQRSDMELGSDPRFVNDMLVRITELPGGKTVFEKRYLFDWRGGTVQAKDTVALPARKAKYQLSFQFDAKRLREVREAFAPRITEGSLRVLTLGTEKGATQGQEPKKSRYKID